MSRNQPAAPPAPSRAAARADFPQILRLNSKSEHYLSPLTAERLTRLHAEAAWHRVIEDGGHIVAFLLAFREGAAYDSPNYRWFGAQYARFLYIDRIVVAASHQGRGLARQLYTELFGFAAESGVTLLTCEFDVEPPNDASRRFHGAFGFSEVGTQRVGAGNKLVSLQAVETGPEDSRAAP